VNVNANGRKTTDRTSADRTNRRAALLSALLALQLVVIAAVLLTEHGVGGAEDGPLLAFESDGVDEIRISATDDGAGVVVSREANGWRLPDGYPADADKVNDVLNRLGNLRAGWPVATSAGASTRFEVAPGAHQRHVVLLAQGEVVADLYLGTSPGYQRVHARRADADPIFSVALANYQLPVNADEWLDKSLLQPRGFLAAVARVGDWQLARGDDGWLIDGEPADQDAASRLERRLVELRVTGVATAPEADALPVAVFEITDPQGPYRLSIYAGDTGNDHRVASDRRDGYFRLASYLADQLLVDRPALSSRREAADAADESDAPEPPDVPGAS
jgi:hypothetical protein